MIKCLRQLLGLQKLLICLLLGISATFTSVANAQTAAELEAYQKLRTAAVSGVLTQFSIENKENYQRLLEFSVQVFGPDDLRTAEASMGLATVFLNAGDFSEAEVTIGNAIRIYRVSGETEFDRLGLSMSLLSSAYEMSGRQEEAWAVRLEISEMVLAHTKGGILENQFLWRGHSRLIRLNLSPEEAEPILQDIVVRIENEPILDSLGADIHYDYALVLHRLQQFTQAELFARKSIAPIRNLLGDGGYYPDKIDSINAKFVVRLDLLATVLFELGRFEEARAIASEAMGIIENDLAGEHPERDAVLERLEQFLAP